MTNLYFISDLSDMAQTLIRIRAVKFMIEIVCMDPQTAYEKTEDLTFEKTHDIYGENTTPDTVKMNDFIKSQNGIFSEKLTQKELFDLVKKEITDTHKSDLPELIEIISNLETITNAEYCELYSLALTKLQEV